VSISKIKINIATKEELSAHPYITWELAKSIVAYRQQHGNLKSSDDLKNLVILDEKSMERLLPYLQFD
jgi:competence protein ComEA